MNTLLCKHCSEPESEHFGQQRFCYPEMGLQTYEPGELSATPQMTAGDVELLDKFAGMAMQAQIERWPIVNNYGDVKEDGGYFPMCDSDANTLSATSYFIAKAMLAERSKHI